MKQAITALLLGLIAHGASAQVPAPPPCTSPEAKQFEFWIGDWDASFRNPDGTMGVGSNRVESMWNGCVTQENFTTPLPLPYFGRSWSVYSPRMKKWQQTWVDSGGAYLDFVGEFGEGKMVLARDGFLGNGKMGKQRMTFYNISADKFDWDWESSEDGGKTWTLRWRINYTRKK